MLTHFAGSSLRTDGRTELPHLRRAFRLCRTCTRAPSNSTPTRSPLKSSSTKGGTIPLALDGDGEHEEEEQRASEAINLLLVIKCGEGEDGGKLDGMVRVLPSNLTLPFIRRAVLNSLLNFPLATLVLCSSCSVDCGVQYICGEEGGGLGVGVANGSLAAHEDRLGWSRGRRVRGIFSLLRQGLSPSLPPSLPLSPQFAKTTLIRNACLHSAY